MQHKIDTAKGWIIRALTILLLLGAAGCAENTYYTGATPAEINASFANGEAVMTCEVSCVGIYHNAELTNYYDHGDWSELATAVLKAGLNNEQPWFYLGSAAAGLGYDRAAQWYYLMSLSAPVPCRRPINICDGLDLPALTLTRLRDLDEKLRTTQDFSQLSGPAANPKDPVSIRLANYQGNLQAPVLLDGLIPLLFVVESGSATVNITPGVAIMLIKNGALHRSDVLGQATGTVANGAFVRVIIFRIRRLQVGSLVLENVIGSISEGQGYLLLGQSFLKRFKSWSMDNAQGNLLLTP